MTITISASGIALDGPLVAGEKVAVTVSGISLAAEDKPTLALLARFPDALLASVELAEDADAPGTWTGELDTATKQTALFFATARADERRDAALELVSGRVSLARLTVPMANSALCPKPDGSPFASPVYIPVPGPPGTGGDPYDQTPEMDGEASAGTADEYARGDHRHPTDESRMAASVTGVDIPAFPGPESPSIEALITNVAKSVPGAGDVTPKMDGTGAAGTSGFYSRADHIHPTDTTRQATISDLAAIRSGAEAGATAVQPSALATVATTGDYGDLLNKPTIPAAQVQSNWNETDTSSKAYIQNKPGHIVQFQNNNNGGTDFKALTVGSRNSSSVRGQPSLVVGDSTKATHPNSAVFGYGCEALDTNSFCQGWFNKVDGNSGATFGQNNYATRGSFSAGRRATSSTGDYGDGTKHQFAFTWQGKTVDTTNTPTVGDNYYHSHGEGTFNINPNPASGSTDPATGFYIGETKLSDYVRYSFAAPTPSVSGTSATVACEDRAINDLTVATGITSLTITPPAAVTGRARDFFCRVTLTDSSLPTVTLSGGTIDIGATEVAGMTQGVNLLMFTEIASGHWLASRRSAS